MHRAVAAGITPASAQHLDRLSRSLAPLHKLDYVTPALVDLAARKIFLHRIHLASPDMERSVQWGSKVDAVKSVLEHVGPEEVIEDVLTMVTAPL
jgi:MoxR-like ATPase